MTTVRKRIGLLCATLLGCGIVVLGSTEFVQAGLHRCSTARKNGRAAMCSDYFGYHPTCWRTWPEGFPPCPEFGPVLQPAEKRFEGTRPPVEEPPKSKMEGDARLIESGPKLQKPDNNGANPVSVP